MVVCIAEKPSVAQDIAKVIGATIRKDGYYEGNGYQVTWTFGHLCSLKAPDDYQSDWKRWDTSTLPMIPQRFGIKLIDDSGIKKQFRVIKSLMAKADAIVNCGDAGQEGELIQRWVMQMAGVKCPVKRLWISSLTEESIRDGFNHLHHQSEYQSLYYAGLCRAIGDWILGMNATRLFTLKYGQHRQVLSIGRVQTPTLALIVNRQKEIQSFQPEPYWVLTTRYRDVLFYSMKGRYQSQEEGHHDLCSVQDQPFIIVDVQKKEGREQPHQLFDLTSLQVECNRRFAFSAETTLNTIQSLYEKKLTTYPRVDTQYLSDDIYSKCPEILRGISRCNPHAASILNTALRKSKKVFDTSKVTDHHAIIPTGREPSTLTDAERKVFDLIVKRFVAVFHPDCIFSTTTVLGKSSAVDFKASGKQILSPGWRVVYQDVADDDEKEKNDIHQVLPDFKEGEYGDHLPSLEQKMTTPPKYYTEATLLQAMETAGRFVDNEELRSLMKENGIGRPSSRASIIETLFKRKYIFRDKKNLMATQTGMDLIDVIQVELLKSCELTGIWEKKLRDIEHQRYDSAKFIEELKQLISQIVKDVLADHTHRVVSVSLQNDNKKKSTPRSSSHARKKASSRSSKKSSAMMSSSSYRKRR